MLKGNKGEWSELYVFAKLLSVGQLFQSDVNLKADEKNCYEIISAYREDPNASIEYERNDSIHIYKLSNGIKSLIGKLSLEYFQNASTIILNGIKNGSGKSFEILELANFISDAHIEKLTALVSSKSDIKLKIYDHRLAKETNLGFSIKSFLGQDSTLFNTGPGNNFIYQLDNKIIQSLSDFNKVTYKPEGRVSKLTARIKALIYDYGMKLKFVKTESHQLFLNLKMIDGDLPEIISHALIYRWVDRESRLSQISNLLEERDPLNFYNGTKSEQRLYEYKLKRFLAECAMGMTSETPWKGIYDATGGVIVAKEDGDIVCFHIYDFNLFREYLLQNTSFEQSSTGEDNSNPGNPRKSIGTKKFYYGWLYEEDDKQRIKLNLQIRFS